ncbi:MAG: extracellular solute-binding protein [Clostridia bacterium]|nr:extracellular solute-binding protein [Clostridia bacterium]
MKTKKTIIPVLCTVLLLTACGSGETAVNVPATTTAVSENKTSDTEAVATTEAYERNNPNLAAIDGGGQDFHIITRELSADYCRQIDDITAEALDGDVLNDALFERNAKVMDKYNVRFQTQRDADVSAKIRKTVMAGDAEWDLFFEGVAPNVQLASQNLLLSLDTLEAVDITRPYWCRGMMDDLSFGGQHYLGVSDLTLQAYFSSGIVYFNKSLAAGYDLENPYDLVNDGKWTLDKLLSMCKSVSADLNGDGVYDEKDQYGITYNNFAWQIMFYGSGLKMVEKDKDGKLYFNGADERVISTLQRLMPISGDPTVCLYSENYKHLGGNYRIDVCQNAFFEGRALFWLEAMYGVTTLRNMELDFGILPVPKYSDEQKDYSSFIHTVHASSVAVPLTVRDPALSGSILEELSYLSSGGAREAFLEKNLKGKISRDNESAKSIDIIIDNICTDYTLLLTSYGLTIDGDMRNLMNKSSTDIMSVFEKGAVKYEKILTKFNDAFGTEG